MSAQTCVILFVVLFGLASSAKFKESEHKPQCIDNTLYSKYICAQRNDGVRLMVPGNCSQYYECTNGVSIVKKCPKFFDPKSQKCVSKSDCVEVDNTSCVVPTPPPCTPKPTTPPVCPPVPECPAPVCPPVPTCPPPPECPGPPTPAPTPSPPTPPTPSPPTPSPPTPPTPTPTPTPKPPCPGGCPWPGGPCDPPFDPNDLYGSFVCRNKPDGTMLITLTSCQDYYYCINGFSYRKSCAKGQLFNPEVNACDIEENVYCPTKKKFFQ